MSGNMDDWIDEACAEYGTSIDPDTSPHTAMGNAIRAFLAAADRDGVVLVRVPGGAEPRYERHLPWTHGYNTALSAVLAGKVTI